MHVGFAKAEATQCPEGLGSGFDGVRLYDLTVGAAVGVAEAGGCRWAVDDELAAMGGAVLAPQTVMRFSASLGPPSERR